VSKPAPFILSNEDARVRGIFSGVGPRALVEETPDRKNVRIYCVSCHHPGAFVSNEAIDLVIYLCDQFSRCGCDCANTKGELTLPRIDS
jgi:hypothetical protein